MSTFFLLLDLICGILLFAMFTTLWVIVTIDDEKYIKKHQKLYTIEYTIISLKMDDDGEYHFIATNSSGTKIGKDESSNDIPIYYGDYPTPKIIRYFKNSYGKNEGYCYKAEIYLPYDYKIDIFND